MIPVERKGYVCGGILVVVIFVLAEIFICCTFLIT